ncbi:hypothetical protein D4764_17G0004320 [Takifugu flavidus]|uniref:Uncharacterized protein n=1 Tax=Takifugu flavidus TaxID=433684 RepID=A0A5C6NWA3_9TELE|nr:hypothetical protein D4764_17G0004320 [Takifugu flavidus]
MRWRRMPRSSEPDSDSFKVKPRQTDDEGDDDEGREKGNLSIQARDARGEKRLRIRQKLEKCDNSAAIFMARGKLVRQELFWDSSEPRDAGSK